MGDEQKLMEVVQGQSTSSKLSDSYKVIGSFMGMGMVGFWFGIGAMLTVKTVNSL